MGGYRCLRPGAGVPGRLALARAGSYAVLALALALAAWTGLSGITLLCAAIAALGLVELCRLTDLPVQHRVALQIASLAILVAVPIRGPASSEILVGGLVLVGIAWPIVRADTRPGDPGSRHRRGRLHCPAGPARPLASRSSIARTPTARSWFVALAVACALSDVAAFLVGRRFGRKPLAPRLSPNKTPAGMAGNLIGAALGLLLFAPVDAGWNVLVFPEGTRSRSGEMAAFKPGIGPIAARTGRPVVPVRLVGIHAVLPPGARRPRRGCVEVRFGAPLRAEAGEDPRAFASRLEAVVRAL
jgi:CDP-diglyceride synthetase